MKRHRLGRTALRPSVLGLGTMTFGEAEIGCDEEESRRIVDAYLAAGGNFVDTADVYASGASEEILGRALRGKRDRVLLATKVGGPTGPGPSGIGLSREHVATALEASLRRLDSEHVDLLQVHAFDPSTPLDETLRALEEAVRAGRARVLGCSNFAAWQLAKADRLAEGLGAPRFECVQARWSLCSREVEREIVPLARDLGLGALAYAPLAGGLLTAECARPGSRRAGQRPSAREQAILVAQRDVAAEVRAQPAQVALAWLCRRPGLTSAILGARSVGQTLSNVEAARLELEPEAIARLDAVSEPELEYPMDLQREVRRMLEEHGREAL